MADKVIVATGGVSYPSTGSTGDGYKFAEKFGHSITEILPSLVPLCEDGDICSEMQGVSLKNVTCTLYQGNKKIYSELGEMLFTHFGVSGPIILSASTRLDHKKFDDTYCVIDLKPALDEGKLDKRILRDFEKYKNKQIKNALGELLLSKMIMPILNYASIDPDKEVNSITKAERESLLKTIKNFKIKINGVRDFKEAIITRGGVNVREIEPGSMQSKKCKNLYFAGEIIDVDAETGGFNLQVAFSSGYLAGLSAATE